MKPCPFCGSSQVKLKRTYTDVSSRQWIECEQCGARGPNVRNLPEYNITARHKWDEREVSE